MRPVEQNSDYDRGRYARSELPSRQFGTVISQPRGVNEALRGGAENHRIEEPPSERKENSRITPMGAIGQEYMITDRAE